MLIIPSVDIKDGKCVRLTQGKPESVIVYQESPVTAALHWQNEGAKYLHIVDLDGAFGGKPVNFSSIKGLLSKITIPAEVGGGIRTIDGIKSYLDLGADRVVLGTQAVVESGFLEKAVDKFGERIALAIDSKGGKVAVEGWVRTADISTLELAKRIKGTGIKTIIYTDTITDGTLKGPNLGGIEQFVEAVGINVIVSGGISTMDDVNKIKALEPKGVTGIIIGKALYTGRLRLEDIL